MVSLVKTIHGISLFNSQIELSRRLLRNALVREPVPQPVPLLLKAVHYRKPGQSIELRE